MSATYAAPLYVPKFRAFNAAGTSPLAGGLVNVYLAGTTTRSNSYPTYTDAINGTNANANPVVLDANGEANIFLPNLFGGGLYKLVLTDSTSVTQWTQDNVNPAGQYLDPRTALSVIKSSSNQVGFATATKVINWSVEVDALSEWSVANNRWVATYAGNYLINATVVLSDTSASQIVALSIYKNGVAIGAVTDRTFSTAPALTSIAAVHLCSLTAGDYIEVFVTCSVNTTVYQSSGTTLAINRIP